MKKNILKTFRLLGLALFLAAGVVCLGQSAGMAATTPSSIDHCGGHYGPRGGGHGGCGW